MNASESNRFLSYIGLGFISVCLIGSALWLFTFFGYTSNSSLNELGVYFDAENYERIAREGYRDLYLHAFFPLFPLVLKALSSTWLAVVFNAVVFIVSAASLATVSKPSYPHFLLFFALPSSVFFLLPYSEAIFFAGSTLFLLSLRRKAVWMGAVGLLIAGLSRPAVSVFLPALLILFWLNPKGYSLKTLLIHASVVVTSFYGAWLIQDLWNGKWALFFQAQKEGWGNEFQLPTFPFTTWGSDNMILWLDLLSLFIGSLSSAYLVYLGIKRIRRHALNIDTTFLFSMLYLAGISAVVLLFRGGELFSLNRFVFATPFMAWILFSGMLRGISLRRMNLFLILLLLVFLSNGAYVHIKVLLGAILFILIATISLNSLRSGEKFVVYAGLCAMVVAQVYFLLKLLRNEWIADLLLHCNEIVFAS